MESPPEKYGEYPHCIEKLNIRTMTSSLEGISYTATIFHRDDLISDLASSILVQSNTIPNDETSMDIFMNRLTLKKKCAKLFKVSLKELFQPKTFVTLRWDCPAFKVTDRKFDYV